MQRQPDVIVPRYLGGVPLAKYTAFDVSLLLQRNGLLPYADRAVRGGVDGCCLLRMVLSRDTGKLHMMNHRDRAALFNVAAALRQPRLKAVVVKTGTGFCGARSLTPPNASISWAATEHGSRGRAAQTFAGKRSRTAGARVRSVYLGKPASEPGCDDADEPPPAAAAAALGDGSTAEHDVSSDSAPRQAWAAGSHLPSAQSTSTADGVESLSKQSGNAAGGGWSPEAASRSRQPSRAVVRQLAAGEPAPAAKRVEEDGRERGWPAPAYSCPRALFLPPQRAKSAGSAASDGGGRVRAGGWGRRGSRGGLRGDGWRVPPVDGCGGGPEDPFFSPPRPYREAHGFRYGEPRMSLGRQQQPPDGDHESPALYLSPQLLRARPRRSPTWAESVAAVASRTESRSLRKLLVKAMATAECTVHANTAPPLIRIPPMPSDDPFIASIVPVATTTTPHAPPVFTDDIDPVGLTHTPVPTWLPRRSVSLVRARKPSDPLIWR
ncbi:hypothetical protein DIPPA_18915 [Diplonema papillatum]|nr:hypothetical protein DIPPA_18915 [Diplonema papillatum]